MSKRDPAQWAMHVYCNSENCGYNDDGHCAKDYIYIDQYETCDDFEEGDEMEGEDEI